MLTKEKEVKLGVLGHTQGRIKFKVKLREFIWHSGEDAEMPSSDSRELPPFGSCPKCLQQPGLVQAKARRIHSSLISYLGGRGTNLSHHPLPSQTLWQGAGLEVDSN